MSHVPGPGDLWLAAAEAREELSDQAAEPIETSETMDALSDVNVQQITDALNAGDWIEVGRLIAQQIERNREDMAEAEQSRWSRDSWLDFRADNWLDFTGSAA